MTASWTQVAFGRTREEAIGLFVQWREESGQDPAQDDVRIDVGRYHDGGSYWAVFVKHAEAPTEAT